MPLKGDLGSFSLAEIFQSLALNQACGTLAVSDGQQKTHLFFSKGQIIPLTRFPLDAPGLDQLLLKMKVVPETAVEEWRAQGERGSLVEHLVRQGLKKEEDLLPLVKQRMEEAIYDLFLWENAHFEFKKEESPKEFQAHLDEYRKVNFASSLILMEAVRRVDEWVRITQRIPSMKYIFVPSESGKEPPEKMADAPLKPSEIWPLLAESHNLARVVEKTGATKFDVCRTVFALLQGWFIRPLPPDRLEMAFKDALKQGQFAPCLMYLEYAQALGLGARDVQERMSVALLSDRVFLASPEVFQLSGNLENIDFASFFLTLFLKKHSGSLRVEDGESRKVVYFSPTEIALLSSGTREQRKFGEILVQGGKLTFRQLDRALTLARERKELLGHVLLQEKMIGEDDLVFAVRQKIIDEIFDVFLWRNARFEFVKNQMPVEFIENKKVSRLPLTSGTHLKDLLGSLTRFGELSKQISSRAIFARQKRDKKDAKGVLGTWLGQMGEAEEQGEKDPLVENVDGKRTVADLIHMSQERGIEICERLYHLLNRGVIRPLGAEELRRGMERATAENHAEEGLRIAEFALERGHDRAFFTKALEDLKARNPGLVEGTREAKLEGDFETFSLAELFQSLHLNKHSGTLKVGDGVNEKMIYFSKGSICLHSRGSREVARLGDILVDAGKVTEEDVSRSLEIQKASAKKLGEILVEEGLVREEDIQEAIREKIKEELFDIFLWERAYFTFTKNFFPEEFMNAGSKVTRLELDTSRILMTAISRMEEWERIESRFQTTKAVFFVPPEANPRLESMPRKERAVFRLIDARNSVEDIIEKSAVGRFQTCQVLFQFLERGFAAPMGLLRLEREAEAAFQRKEFDLCVKYYEYALRLDESNQAMRQTLDLLRGNLPRPGVGQTKIRVKGVDLTSLFQGIVRERRSGMLSAKDAKSRRLVYLAPDEILLLTEGERRGPSVEESLMAQGRVTDKQLERARQRQAQLGGDLALILEKQGIVAYNEVEKLRKKKVFDDLEDLFRWPDVSIEFEPNVLLPALEDAAKEVLGIRMNVGEMLEKIVARIAEWQRLRKQIVSEDVVFQGAAAAAREGRVRHVGDEKVLALVDGKTPFGQILKALGGDWFEVWTSFKRLMDSKIVRPLSAEEAFQAAENALVFNERETALTLYRSAMAVEPGNARIREKFETVQRKGTTIRRAAGETLIREARIENVLKNIIDRKRAGTFTATRQEGTRTVYVSVDRMLLLSSGECRGRYLGEVLEECGFAAHGQIEKALAYQQRTRKRLGEILVLQGILTEANLSYALREKVLEDLHDLFRWEKARFRFDEGPPPEALTDPAVPLTDAPWDAYAVLAEALAREQSWAEIGKVIPSDHAVFLSLDPDSRKGDRPQRNPILAQVTGKRPVAQIVRLVRASRFANLNDLAKLARTRVIRLLTVEEARRAAGEAYMFNDFPTAIDLYTWLLEIEPGDEKAKANLDRARALRGG